MTGKNAEECPTRLVVIREQLEDREIANFVPLSATMHVQLVTSRAQGPYSATGLGLPCTTLRRRGDVIPVAAVRRRLRNRLAHRADLDRLRGLDAVLAKANVACVNETHMVSSLQAVEAKDRYPGLRVVTVCYENIPFNYDADPVLAARRRSVRNGTDDFIAMTPGAAEALQAEGVTPERIHVIPYGVDLGRFSSRSDRGIVRAQLGIDDADLAFIFTGRLLREKGLVELVLALARLNRDDAHLILAGAGPERERVQTAVHAAGMSNRVHWVDWVKQEGVPALLSAADVFVLPSLPTPYWEEQLGFSVIEALAAGLPVIGTDSGSIPFLVGDAGVTVRPYDNAALTQALDALTRDRPLREALRDRALRRARSDFDVNVVAMRLAEVIDRTTGRSLRAVQALT